MSATPTVPWAPWVYGAPETFDPAEGFHEASKLSPVAFDHRPRGMLLLSRSPEAAVSATRSVLRSRTRPAVELPPAALPRMALAEAVARRRSSSAFGDGALTLADVSALLAAAYGVTARPAEGPARRSVPSGGALYPLELYALTARVDGLEHALHHYDPLRHSLERMPAGEPGGTLSPYGEVVESAALVVVVTGVFWRSRFKYGLRGYRFALLEAGHVGQSLLLAAVGLGLAALPLGGFFDRRVERLLGVDGVNEAAVYAFAVGRPA